MEVDDGVVAIVQSSRHAGLTVTLLPERHTTFKMFPLHNMGLKPTRGSRSNVETNTERVAKNSSVPVWDVRYDSGYQFANCLRLSSHQQRNEFLGNGSGEMGQSLCGGTRPDGCMYHRRSSQFGPSPLPPMGHFMQSLRRYPRATSSAELVNRLLDYTHSKHQTTKHHTRSSKSLLRKSTSQHTNRVDEKQGNKVTNKTNSAAKQFDRPFSVVGKRCSSQEELLNYTYDYLKSATLVPQTLVPQRTDVRYLTGIKRALRDKLREIIDVNAEDVCPSLQSRYNLHRRLYHGNTPKHSSTSAQDSPRSVHICPKTCVCDTKSYEVQFLNALNEWVKCIPVYPDFSEEDKKIQNHILKELTNNLKELDETKFNLKAKKEILQTLDTLPMWHPTDSNEDTVFKENLADKLIEKLSTIDKKIANKTEIFEEKDDNRIELYSRRINNEDMKILSHKSSEIPNQGAINYFPDDEQHKEALKSEQIDLFKDLSHKYENRKNTVNSKMAEILPQHLRNTELSTMKQMTDKLNERNGEVQKKVKLSNLNVPENRKIKNQMEDQKEFLNGGLGKYDSEDLESRENKSYDRSTLKLIKKGRQRGSNLNKDIPKSSFFNPGGQNELDFLRNKISEYCPDDQEVSKSKTIDINNLGLIRKHQQNVSDWSKDMPESSLLNGSAKEKFAQVDIEDMENKTNNGDTLALKDYQKVSDRTKDILELSHLYPHPEQNKLAKLRKNKKSEYDSEDIEESGIQKQERAEYNECKAAVNRRFDSQTKPKFTKQIKLGTPSDESKTDDENTLGLIKKQQTNEIPESSRLHATEQKKLAKIQKNEMSEYNSEDIEVSKVQTSEHRENNEHLNKEAAKRRFDSQNKPKFSKKIKQELLSDESISDEENILLKKNDQQNDFKWNKEIQELSHFYAPEEQKKLAKFQKYQMGEDELDDTEEKLTVHRKKNEWFDEAAVKVREDIQNEITKNKIQESHLDESKIYDQNFLSLVNKWFEGIPKLAGVDRIENKKDLQDLATQLYEIQTSGEDFENIQVDTWEAITDWLQFMLRKRSKRLSSATIEILTNKLVKKIKNTPPIKKIYMQNEGDMHDDIVTLLRDIPGLDADINLDNAIEDLIITLNDIRNSDEFIAIRTRDAINNFIEVLSEDTGVNLLPKDRELLKRTLLQRSKQEQQHRKSWNKQNRFGSSTPKASRHYSFSPNLSPIRNVSLDDGQTELDKYLNTLNNAIDSWIKGLELTIGIAELRNLIGDIVSDIVDRQKYLQHSNNKSLEADELEHLKFQIFRRLNKLNVKGLPKIISRVSDLNKRILSIKAPELTKPFHRSDLPRRISNLVNSLKSWLDNIPRDLARSHNNTYSDEVFQDLAYKLAHLEYKINYYYFKNEICQWLLTIFTNIDQNTLNNLADSLIKHLVNNLTTQDRTHTGSTYRLMLWDTISKTLPPINLSAADDLHVFDLHKERLVDAFINLHYFAEDMVALEKFKTKLLDEVNKFCNEYLQRYPESPLNPEELGKNLYSALRKVSLPDIETVRSELEQVRLKEEIMDWLQTVPFDKSKKTEPQINAKVSDLAKRLHELEKDKHLDSNKYIEMKLGIIVWLQSLSVKDGEQMTPLVVFADVLVDKLKTTDKSRTLSISNIGKHGDNIIPQYPQSNLSVEDRAHLDRIRRTSDYSRGGIKTDLCRDSRLSLPLRECGMQTEINSTLEGSVHIPPSLYGRRNNREVSPQVIIKEYYWDSTSTNVSQRSLDPRRPLSPPCGKLSETAPHVIRIRQCTKNSNAQTDQVFKNTHTQSSQADRICNSRNYSLGCLEDRTHFTRPPCYLPENIRTSTDQRMNLPSEIIESRRSRGDHCGQRRYNIKCRGRSSNHKSHCNRSAPETSSKYCPNCASGCPYPSNLFFKQEF